MKPGTQIPSSTGGTITYTRTGLVHTAGSAYSGRSSESPEVVAKKQRGRPKKNG
jgi:hypothetical protein